jgi:hypothetical protein
MLTYTMSVNNSFSANSVFLRNTSNDSVELAAPASATPYSLTLLESLQDNTVLQHTTGGALGLASEILTEGLANGSAACSNTNDIYGFANDLATYIASISDDLNLESSTQLTIKISDGSPVFTLTADDATLTVPIQYPVYADATARDAAISVPVASMVIYNTALAKLQVYTTGWETVNSV